MILLAFACAHKHTWQPFQSNPRLSKKKKGKGLKSVGIAGLIWKIEEMKKIAVG